MCVCVCVWIKLLEIECDVAMEDDLLDGRDGLTRRRTRRSGTMGNNNLRSERCQ
jgi:hypothetical protein